MKWGLMVEDIYKYTNDLKALEDPTFGYSLLQSGAVITRFNIALYSIMFYTDWYTT